MWVVEGRGLDLISYCWPGLQKTNYVMWDDFKAGSRVSSHDSLIPYKHR